MPYIKQGNRRKFDKIIAKFEAIINLDGGHAMPPGELNYVIFNLIKKFVDAGGRSSDGLNYTIMQEAIGAALLAVDEYKRRYLHPYEDKMIIKNGDVDT